MLNSNALFSALPQALRDELLACHRQIVRNYSERRWEPAELNGGKFCEVVYTILDGATSGSFAPSAAKPAKMVEACRALEGRPADASRLGDRSLRVLIPRLLPFLYEIRNNRGVGHVGGDVNPNQEDAEAVLAMSNWVMAELVRIFHKVPLGEAQAAVTALVERRHALIWVVDDIRRVLDPGMSKSDQTVAVLYSVSGWTGVRELYQWVEYSSLALYKSRILEPLHDARLVEYDAGQLRACITPKGMAYAETNLLPR